MRCGLGWTGRRGARSLVLVTVLATLLAGCGGDDAEPDTTPTPVTSAEPTEASSSETDDASTPTDGDATDGSDAPDDDALAGTPIELFWQVGDELGVVGVAADDVLNVRAGPGTDEEVVATLEPLATGVEVVGETRQLPSSFWVEVDADGTTGWANVRFLAFIGGTDDLTSQILPMLPDDGRAETMLMLGEAVAATQASTDPPSTVTVVDGPSVGDLGEITLDVIGLGDDSVLGVRLHVFGQPDEGGEGFGLKSVEATTLCARGAGDDGMCV